MKTFKLTAAQGECNIRRIDATAIPAGLAPVTPEKGLLIVGHSESGHHHGFRAQAGIALLERTKDVPQGMKILYAILENPTELIQDAAAPHEPLMLDAGAYEVRISREFDPFAEQARRVAD
jgi:hypothetical protein